MLPNGNYLFKSAEFDSDTLIVSFSPHNSEDKFFKYKTLLTNQQTDVLFLNNNNSWYLDTDNGQSYRNLLKNILQKYKKENVLFFGSSMGAYGALFHGIYFDVNIFATNPQINEQVVLQHEIAEHGNYAQSLKSKNIKLITPEEMYNEKNNNIDSIIYLIYGDSIVDVNNLKEFLKYIPVSVKIILEKLSNEQHIYYTQSTQDLMCRFDIMKQLRNVTYSN